MEEFKNLKEIIELCSEELIFKDENVNATLDGEDLRELQNLINKYKEQEAIIIALKGANVVINQDLKEFKNSMAIISEICVDESKCHITSREAVEEIRKNIFWKAKGE